VQEDFCSHSGFSNGFVAAEPALSGTASNVTATRRAFQVRRSLVLEICKRWASTRAAFSAKKDGSGRIRSTRLGRPPLIHPALPEMALANSGFVRMERGRHSCLLYTDGIDGKAPGTARATEFGLSSGWFALAPRKLARPATSVERRGSTEPARHACARNSRRFAGRQGLSTIDLTLRARSAAL